MKLWNLLKNPRIRILGSFIGIIVVALVSVWIGESRRSEVPGGAYPILEIISIPTAPLPEGNLSLRLPEDAPANTGIHQLAVFVTADDRLYLPTGEDVTYNFWLCVSRTYGTRQLHYRLPEADGGCPNDPE